MNLERSSTLLVLTAMLTLCSISSAQATTYHEINEQYKEAFFGFLIKKTNWWSTLPTIRMLSIWRLK